jgi:NifU-like protein involved in Fe-S cluster formation
MVFPCTGTYQRLYSAGIAQELFNVYGARMEDLYREIIIDHYKNPVYRGHLDPNDIQFEDDNPLCGDHIEITLRVDGASKVADGRFDGKA